MRPLAPFVAVLLAASPTSSPAQAAPLTVLRHTPEAETGPGAVVTVTFDRPVAGRLEETIPAERIFRIEPALAGTVAWRDPVTMQFVPREPVAPGGRYTVVIDSAFRAIDGSRLASPYRFTFRVIGARMLVSSFAGPGASGTLAVGGAVWMLYSAALDPEAFASARLSLDRCDDAARLEGQQEFTIPLRIARQRVVGRQEDPRILGAGGWGRDTVADRFRRIVELVPERPPPEDCAGRIVLPTTGDDGRHGVEERFPVRTARAFRIVTEPCFGHQDCAMDRLDLRFSAPVGRADVLRHVRFDPSITAMPAQRLEPSATWSFPVRLLPNRTYQIVVDSTLRDVHGRPLTGPRVVRHVTGHYRPAVGFARGLLVAPSSVAPTLRLRHVNVRSVLVTVHTIPPDRRLRALTVVPGAFEARLEQLPSRTDTAVVTLPASIDEERTTDVRLPGLAAAQPGALIAYRVDIRSEMNEPPSAGTLQVRGRVDQVEPNPRWGTMQVSDLAMHARLGVDEHLVRVTGRLDERPRSGANVRYLRDDGTVLAEGRTDAQGIARLPLSVGSQASTAPIDPRQPPEFLLDATFDDDRLTLPFRGFRLGYQGWTLLLPQELGGRPDQPPRYTSTLFVDRGIHRPGEMLHVAGVLREGSLGALTAPAPIAVRLSLQPDRPYGGDDDDAAVLDTLITTSEFGTIVHSTRLPSGLRLGPYRAVLRVRPAGTDTAWQYVADQGVLVAEYRAPEFLVEAVAGSEPRYGNDTARVRVTARYLFGAAMTHARVQWAAHMRELEPWEIEIPGAKGWTVGESLPWSERSWQRDVGSRFGDDSLDATGSQWIRVPLGSMHPSRPARLLVEASVTDVNRQVVSEAASLLVHPARLYVLARRQGESWYWRTGASAVAEIRTVRPDGAVAAGIAVVARIVHREWNWDGGNGRWIEDTVRVDTLRTRAEPVALRFVPARGGLYEVRLSALDERGAEARTTLATWTLGARGGWGWRSPYQLTLMAPESEFAVGELAEVVFDSPFADGEAWIALERERVLEQWLVRVKRGRNTIPVRLTGAHAPNVFVSVMLVRRSGPARPDSAHALMRAGYAELRVSADSKRLRIALSPRDTLPAPGDSVHVDVNVRDATGKGAESELVVWAVDEGVLALTDYRTPDVLASLNERRGLGGSLWSTLPLSLTRDPALIVMLQQRQALDLSGGLFSLAHTATAVAEATPEAALLRSKFRSTAFFVGQVRTDSAGRATVTAQLPDNITTYRLMAVAVTRDDRAGLAESPLLATRPLVVRPSLPRFVRAGDSLFAGAVVNVRDGARREARVTAEANGLSLRGERARTVMLAEGKGAEARFELQVAPRDSAPDSVSIRLDAHDGTHADAVRVALPVRADFHPRVHTRMGMLRGAEQVTVPLPAGIDPARSRVRVQVGNSPLAPMLAAYDRLRTYPYACTEQIASGGRALIATWRARRESDPTAFGDARERLQAFADAIVRRQKDDGSFRYWDSDHPWTSPWLTTYAGLFLLEARGEGVVVDGAVLAGARKYLQEFVAKEADTTAANRYDRVSIRVALGHRVAAVEFLRRSGEPEERAENALLERVPAMSWEDRLRLAELLAPRENVRDSVRALVARAWRDARDAGGRVELPDSVRDSTRDFPSRVAPVSRLLSATLAVAPEHPRLGALTETLLQTGRAERHWSWNTQDYASVVMALAESSRGASVPTHVAVRSRGRALFDRRVGAVDSSEAVPLDGLLERDGAGGMRLRLDLRASRSDRPLYYAVSVEEVPSRAPTTPDIKGIVVERWYERFDDGRPVTALREGELVRVRLRVTVPSDRQFVALEDPIPAGLEPVDLSLRTTSSLRAFATPESEAARTAGESGRDGSRWQSWLYGSWDEGWWSPWEHKALHDDKVTWFARMLWAGSYTASYVARATTSGSFARPPAHAEEMYNPALQGRSDGGRFGVVAKPE